MTPATPAIAPHAKADILAQALPYIRQFHGKTMVIKYGGNAMTDPALQKAFAEDVVYLRHTGIRPVIVHGGGPQINRMLGRLGIESEFQGGYRVTTPETMDVVRMVLTGKVNPELVDEINAHGPIASGTTGEDAGLFIGRRRPPLEVDGKTVDLGRVGDIIGVRPESVLAVLEAGHIPVVSSIAPDVDNPGESLNVNATALGAEKLVILTDVAGLYANWPDTDSLVSTISAPELEAMLPTLESGMIPKMQACLDAVNGGVSKAAIIDGREPHSVLLEIFTESGIGTEVVPG